MPQYIWDVEENSGKNIYLTFDDGPEPYTTSKVQALLLKFDAKATFFCLGKNAVQHPDILKQLKDNGHAIGNHGYDHLSGLGTKNKAYFENFEKGKHILNTDIFRPPYGRILPWQAKKIRPHSKIIMWSILSKDYNTQPQTCIRNVLKHARPGAIIVFHDTPKASACLLIALPIILESLHKNGYKFKTLY